MAGSDGSWGAQSEALAPDVGQRIGPYVLRGVLGSGASATVFLADADDGDPVAIKILDPARVMPDEVRRFEREYEALAMVESAHVVRVFQTGVFQGYPWIAMEFVEGQTLEQWIEARKSEPSPQRFDAILSIAQDLCTALSAIHNNDIFHRDLKPSNILLTQQGAPKITDFGVVKRGEAEVSTEITLEGRLVGTVAYMAPELISEDMVDARTDLYALGAILYQMCTFRRPIEASSIARYLAKHLTEIPEPISHWEPDVPEALERVCQRLLEKDPDRRYPNAAAVAAALHPRSSTTAHPMRGRDQAVSTWNECTTRLQEGVGGVLLVVGAPGSGKSRLLEAFRALALAQDLRVLQTDDAKRVAVFVDELSESLDEAPDTPLIALVDNIESARTSDISMLSGWLRTRLVLEARPVLLVLVANRLEGEVGPIADGSATGIPADVLELGPIDPRSAIALVRDQRLAGPAVPLLARRLHREYDGLPGPMLDQIQALRDESWLAPVGEEWHPIGGIERLSSDDLPLPPSLLEQTLKHLRNMEPATRAVCTVLSLFESAAPAVAVLQATESDGVTPETLDRLVRRGQVARLQSDGFERLTWVRSITQRALRLSLPPDRRRQWHRRIADATCALGRRSDPLQTARHYRAADLPNKALPFFVQSARLAAHEKRYTDVLAICKEIEALSLTEPSGASQAGDGSYLWWLHALRGEAELGRRQWDAAIAPLEHAVWVARHQEDRGRLSLAQSLLGRAQYRAGRFDIAAPILEEVLVHADRGAAERAAANRALADIELQRGNFARSEFLWSQALETASATHSADAEARARRGLAHLHAIMGQYSEAGRQLAVSDTLLSPDGDPRVRAGVLARASELDIAAGRLGSALYRTDLLNDLARRYGMGERLAEAHSLRASALVCIGDNERAVQAANRSLAFAATAVHEHWGSILRATRVLARCGHAVEALAALPAHHTLPRNQVHQPVAQATALRAWLALQPEVARRHAEQALAYPAPQLAHVCCDVLVDVARAQLSSGDAVEARSMAKRALRRVHGMADTDGLRLEILAVMHRASPDRRVEEAINMLIAKLKPSLPPRTEGVFAGRTDLRYDPER